MTSTETLMRRPRWLPKGAAREAVAVWGFLVLTMVLLSLVSPQAAKLAATAGFLYAPLWASRHRGEDFAEYGLHGRHLRRDLGLAALVLALLLPLFSLGYWAAVRLLASADTSAFPWLAPFTNPPPFSLRFPSPTPEWLVDHLLVVAIPEEFFYRGYLQTRLRDAWPQGKIRFGVRMGPAFFVTAALFTLGHAARMEWWIPGIFFPALLFGWLREKTGSLWASIVVHGASNLLIQTLGVSFFGR